MVESKEVIIKLDKITVSPACGSVIPLEDGRLMWAWGSGHDDPVRGVCAIYSDDEGLTWGEPQTLKLQDGADLTGFYCTNLFRLASGALGLVLIYMAEKGEFELERSWLHFHKSEDEGRTWSPAVQINAPDAPALTNADRCLALKDGRLIVPAYTMIMAKSLGNPKIVKRFGEEFALCLPRCGIGYSYVYYSDDEGSTWAKSRNATMIVMDQGTKGCYAMVNPAVVELKDGRLLMFGRTNLGRLYKAYSDDRGETWSESVPTELALLPSPCSLKRIPGTGDLLVVWNQNSRWEMLIGAYRHRLSCAVSRDEGETWQNHKNLASLDDVTRIEPDEPGRIFLGPHSQPADRKRYHRTPGPLRCGQPTCTFLGDKAFITHGLAVFGDKDVIKERYGIEYDDLMARLGIAPFERANKMHVLPVEWFYS